VDRDVSVSTVCVDRDASVSTVERKTEGETDRERERQSAERLRLLVGVALRRCIVGVGRVEK
jgi:hypothetical protein